MVLDQHRQVAVCLQFFLVFLELLDDCRLGSLVLVCQVIALVHPKGDPRDVRVVLLEPVADLRVRLPVRHSLIDLLSERAPARGAPFKDGR